MVHFITEEEMKRNHSGLLHGGCVIRTGVTGLEREHKHVIEYSLKLESNQEFTSTVIVAYVRAVYRMNQAVPEPYSILLRLYCPQKAGRNCGCSCCNVKDNIVWWKKT